MKVSFTLSVILSAFCFDLKAIECGKILMVFPGASPSHFFLGNALARGLVEAGHDVTMVAPYDDKKSAPKNGTYRNVVLAGLEDGGDNKPPNLFEMKNLSPFMSIMLFNFIGKEMTDKTLSHPNFQKLLKSNEKFDVVIIEQFHGDAIKGLAHYYQAPLILFSTVGANAWFNPLIGNPSPPSYVPVLFSSFSHSMSFLERAYNSLVALFDELNRYFYFFPMQNDLLKKHFPNSPNLDEILYNTSIVFVNSHESVNQAVPHVPNMIDIGGFHVQPAKKLPKDLQDFLDNAKEGVVYFSMGSNLLPSHMRKDQKEAIVNALGKLKQKVLWKSDEESIPNQPENIKLSKWFPQADLLAHSNVKLFITHGGLLSTTETIYHGIPILAIPIFGDQEMNAAEAQEHGYAINLSYGDLTEQIFTEALDKLLNDPKYMETAKKRSQLMHDRPVKPMDLAVYWTEFVMRHRGAPHLRVAGVDLPWYQYHLIDVIFVFALVSIFFWYVVYIVTRKIFGRKGTQKKEKTN